MECPIKGCGQEVREVVHEGGGLAVNSDFTEFICPVHGRVGDDYAGMYDFDEPNE